MSVWLMTGKALRLTGLSGLIVIGLTHAAPAGPGGGPPGGGSGFGGPPPGGYGTPQRGSGTSQERSDDYDYSSPAFNFSVRKKRHDCFDEGGECQRKKPGQVDRPEPDLWERLRSGFGMFGR